jgi:hypothetical protein
MLGIAPPLASNTCHPRLKNRARRRTSTTAEALQCKRLPRRQRRRRREGRGIERALASTRHSQSLRQTRRSATRHLSPKTQAAYIGNVRHTIRSLRGAKSDPAANRSFHGAIEIAHPRGVRRSSAALGHGSHRPRFREQPSLGQVRRKPARRSRTQAAAWQRLWRGSRYEGSRARASIRSHCTYVLSNRSPAEARVGCGNWITRRERVRIRG